MSARVVLLSPVPLDSPRGNAVTVARIATRLRARGLDVSVWAAGAAGLEEDIERKPPLPVHAFHAYHTGPLRPVAGAGFRRPPGGYPDRQPT